ncbi:ATP-grasp domain-containing protein [Amycolatopsis anabasis]|uniref:ATP-grasp domain-containing protein n=1 Tax=Amycolatopsis anabasis TaxID=1840409 RepID=UPI00131DA6E7|nr:ATP-grasp domain-containing protein [Amycolatopsis anabasis]
MTRTVVIVDAYSTARHLPTALRAYDVHLVHVQSSPEVPGFLRRSYHPENFDEVLPFEPASQIAARLEKRPELTVLAGAESGVLFADDVCARLGLDWNVPELSTARRDKYTMIEALRRAGLPVAQQIRSDDPEEIVRWSREQRDWPVVLKPPLSTSSEDVYFCTSAADIRAALPRIVGKTNLLGVRNDVALAQTYLEGPIYVVNSVSHDGEHLTTDVWCFEFVQGTHGSIKFIEHRLLPEEHEFFGPLDRYNRLALDAVGIRNGPSHAELKMTARGPQLVETSARLMGATIEREPFAAALGTTQVELTAMALCDPDRFRTRLRQPYHLAKRLKILWVHFPEAGTITGDEGCARLAELPSFAGYYGRPQVGDDVRPSTDTTGKGGFVYLLSDDDQALAHDSALARKLIETGELFAIAPRAAGGTR